MRLFFIAVFLCVSAQAQGFTQMQLDDWLDETAKWIYLEGLENHNVKIEYTVDVCVEGKIILVHLYSPRGVGTFTTMETTGSDCLPSTDGNGNPLPITSFLKSVPPADSIFNTQRRGGAVVAAAAPVRAAFANPAFRNIPFIPIYDPALVVATPACDPSLGAAVYQVNHGTSSVTRITACTGTKTVIPVTSNPLALDITPDGSQIIVTSFDNAITFINTANNTVAGVLRTPFNVNPSGIAISPDGTTAYVTSFNVENPGLLVVDVAKRAILQMIPTTSYPQSVFLNPDGSLAWVTFPFQNSIYLVDTLTNTVSRNLSVSTPFGVAFNSTGTRAYITNGTAPGTLQVLDTATYKTVQTVPVGGQPVDVVVAPDDAFLMVTNYLGMSISVIDPKTFAVDTIPLQGRPRGLALIQ